MTLETMNERLARREVSTTEPHRWQPMRSILVIGHTPDTQVKEENGDEVQRENIFHTRCLIQDRTCNMIINGGSCANVASNVLMEKLNFPTLKHLRPYNLQWLNECRVVKVTK